MNEAFLVLNNISKRFVGVRALDSVSVVLKESEIHCLVGENGSGKSTLVKIISGVEQPDEGELLVRGQPVSFAHTIDSIRQGVEVIYQDMSLFPNLSVAENIVVSHRIERGERLIRWHEVKEIARAALEKVRVEMDLRTIVGRLSVANQQLVAICRALTSGVQLLVMDEATTALTKKEIDRLFAVIEDLRSRGISVLFVSHKLNEVLQIAETVTILRDGKSVGTYVNRDLTDEKITFLMTGKRVEKSCLDSRGPASPIALEAKGLAKRNQFNDVNLALHEGEIVGLTGLLGAGRTELALALFGLNKPDSGEIRVFGKRAVIRSVRDAVKLGIGYVPENRIAQGLIMQQSVSDNLQMTTIDRLTGPLHLLSRNKRERFTRKWVESLGIKVGDVSTPVQTLSGGNQQRVVIAKWLAIGPKILILDGPTVGIDIAAKAAIHQMIRELANGGISVLLISDEVVEVLNNCDRVLVMKEGSIIKELPTSGATKELIQQVLEANGND